MQLSNKKMVGKGGMQMFSTPKPVPYSQSKPLHMTEND